MKTKYIKQELKYCKALTLNSSTICSIIKTKELGFITWFKDQYGNFIIQNLSNALRGCYIGVPIEHLYHSDKINKIYEDKKNNKII